MDNCDNCPLTEENNRLKFEIGCTRVRINTILSHTAKDILELEMRMLELQDQLRNNHNGKAV